MKRNILFSICLMVCCLVSAQTSLSLKGEAHSLKDGEKLYLIAGGNTPADSAIIKNGKFEFSMKGIQPCECCLVRKGEKTDEYILFYLDYCPTYITIEPGTYNCFNTNFMNCKVTGNPTDTAVRAINDVFLRSHISLENDEKFCAMLKAVVARHDMASAYVTNKYRLFVYKAVPESEIGDCIDKMSPIVKQSIPGQEMIKTYGESNALRVGAVAPDFTLNDVNGQPVSLLKFVKGKNLVLIDFWASWCKPCREEGKNIKSIYTDYHQKGFDVLGISLDEKMEDCKKGIQEEGYQWTILSDVKGFSSSVCKTYHVSSIPYLMLVDGDGMIIAKDLRGEELKNKVAEYCQ